MLTACLLFCIGLFGLITRGHLMRNVMSLNVMGGGVFLFLVAVARRDAGESGPDPVPHAMTLTGIVVALAASAFALALARRIHSITGEMRLEPGDDNS
ncbi:MAG: NADH-quinone oxidoreductase subunit K [Phycisphaeraceae bacterium]|nr:MAG: NADH-quinone oxidoreductase subunit K [Phycisphaeraceae bacterium]